MTLTDIANLALTEIGSDEIQSIDDNSKIARIIKKRLDLAIEDIQVLRDWSCLIRNVKLNPRCGETPTGEKEFNLPKGILRIISTSPNVSWKREGNSLIAPAEDLKIRCILKNESPSDWDTGLRNAIVARLESSIVMSITQNADLARNIMAMAEKTVSRAMAEDELNARSTNRNKKYTGWFA